MESEWMEILDLLLEILHLVNVGSISNGRRFVSDQRVRSIRGALVDSAYELVKDGKLCMIYQNRHFRPDMGAIIISNHIDSVYPNHFHRWHNDTEMLGTFDNSVCNAVIVYLMKNKRLPANALVAFTGDEEAKSRGALEAVNFLRLELNLLDRVELVVVLDVTAEAYSTHSFTIENYQRRKSHPNGVKLRFRSDRELKEYLRSKLSTRELFFLSTEEAAPDESDVYRRFGLNCMTFCLPVRPLPENSHLEEVAWMHHPKGILVNKDSIVEYMVSLSFLCRNVSEDLKK